MTEICVSEGLDLDFENAQIHVQPGPSMTSLVCSDPSKMVCSDPSRDHYKPF